MAHDVFISYSRKNTAEAKILCEALSEANISFWIDKEDIPVAAAFSSSIANAIESSKLLVFISSTDSKESEYVTLEVFYALNHQVIVVPFKIDNEPFNDKLKLYLDIYNHYPAFPPPISKYLGEFICKINSILKVQSSDKPFFKRITDENDPDMEVLLTIYKSCFPADKNVSEEFIVRNLTIISDEHKAYLFILKKVNKIVGIADVSYFPKIKRIFVSYVGVYHYRSVGDQLIFTYNIIDGLINYFAENNLPVVDIVFETEAERIFKYFSRILRNRFQLTPYKLNFDYVQPKMLADNSAGVTNEIPSLLIYIPINNRKHLKTMSKKQVLKIIHFLHSEIYFDITDASTKEHKAYLNQLYSEYEKSLPDLIELSDN